MTVSPMLCHRSANVCVSSSWNGLFSIWNSGSFVALPLQLTIRVGVMLWWFFAYQAEAELSFYFSDVPLIKIF